MIENFLPLFDRYRVDVVFSGHAHTYVDTIAIVYSRGRSSDYDRRLMRPWKDLLCSIPVWPALGNHDWKSPPEDNWEQEWYLPNNEHYYSFDYANAHFIALDTRDGDLYDRGNQVRWLEQDLVENADADWIFVYYHHPGITCTYKRSFQGRINRRS